MSRFLLCVVCLFFPLWGHAADASWLRGMRDCFELESEDAFKICTRISRSREYLEHVHPKLIANKAGIVVAREAVLVTWDQDDRPHIVWLTIPARIKRGENFTVTSATRGYMVERIRGTGPYKLEFRVRKEETGVELKVYGGKFLWIPRGYAHGWRHDMLAKIVEKKQYLPFQDHLYHPELVGIGLKFLESMIDRAQEELGEVPSKAFPGWMLPDAYPNEVVLNLIVSEHADPFRLFDESVPTLLPRSMYLLGVLVEMAMHGPRAFAKLCSFANACGWTQFTNSPSGSYPGTYTHTYNTCRTLDGKPVIMRDFNLGTLDPHNALKAAFCYLDMENAALPKEARLEYLRDPKRGSIYMLTAYNAGGRWSRRVFENVQSFRKRFGRESEIFRHDLIPKVLFHRGTFYNHETHWYIKKYLLAWDMIHKDRVIEIPAIRRMAE